MGFEVSIWESFGVNKLEQETFLYSIVKFIRVRCLVAV